jgi:hypothetical protein
VGRIPSATGDDEKVLISIPIKEKEKITKNENEKKLRYS